MNVNNLLLCSQSHSIKSTSRLLRWNSPCTASISVAGSNRLFSTVPSNLCKSFPKLMIYQNVQNRLISSSSLNCKNNTNKAAASFDDDDPDGVSVYEGKYTKQILRVKMFSLTTSAMGLVAQPVLWQKGIEVSGTGLSVLICSVAGIFTFVTPLLLHFVTKKYVIDIKYNEKTDEYTCITISFFLFKNRVSSTLRLINKYKFDCNAKILFFKTDEIQSGRRAFAGGRNDVHKHENRTEKGSCFC